MTSQERAFHDFAAFAATLQGDEKSEAQTFLFHLLEAFGHDPNTLPAGSTFEYRVRFPGDRTKFADFVWPQRVLFEMKSRGAKLSKHYQQTFDYWLIPDLHTRPGWATQRSSALARGRNTPGEIQNAILDDIVSALERLARA